MESTATTKNETASPFGGSRARDERTSGWRLGGARRLRDAYAHAYEQLLWPAWQRVVRKRPTFDRLTCLEISQWRTPDEIETLQIATPPTPLGARGDPRTLLPGALRQAPLRPAHVQSRRDLAVLPLLDPGHRPRAPPGPRRPVSPEDQSPEGNERLDGHPAHLRVLRRERELAAGDANPRLSMGRLPGRDADVLLLARGGGASARVGDGEGPPRSRAPAGGVRRSARSTPTTALERGCDGHPKERAPPRRRVHAGARPSRALHRRSKSSRLGGHARHLRRRGRAPRRSRGARIARSGPSSSRRTARARRCSSPPSAARTTGCTCRRRTCSSRSSTRSGQSSSRASRATSSSPICTTTACRSSAT